MNQFLEAALGYAGLGWRVFPLSPGQKVPITTHGVKDATTDEAQIRDWWQRWPNANVAVACGKESGVYVVDVDVSADGSVNGLKSLGEFPPLPDTVRQDTPRGGFHAFFRTDDPPANKNAFRPGIDIRGDGYYVVLAPSIHPNGGKYAWTRGCDPWDIPLAEYPDFMRPVKRQPQPAPLLVPRVHQDDTMRRASAYLDCCPPGISGQSGHARTFAVTQALIHGFGLSDDRAFLLLSQWNLDCEPPWSEKELRHKIESAHKHPPSKPPGWLLLDNAYAPVDALACKVDVAALLASGTQKQTQADEASEEPPAEIEDAGEYLEREPPPDEPLFPNVIDKGDKVFIVSQSKAGKSFYVLQLALCAASGRPFLTWKPCAPFRVLVVQFELKRAKYWKRVRKIASALGIKREDLGGRLAVVNLRGKVFSFDKLQAAKYDLIIIDPFYKVADREDANENEQKDVSRLLRSLDVIAEIGPAVCVVHHGTKGRIGDKQVIDRASGSGVIARDFDGLFTLAPHQDHPSGLSN